MRIRSPPPSAGGTEQGKVRLSLMMNAVALQSLSTLASLATALQALPPLPAGEGSGVGQTNINLIRAPFAMLADMLEDFPEQSLVRETVVFVRPYYKILSHPGLCQYTPFSRRSVLEDGSRTLVLRVGATKWYTA